MNIGYYAHSHGSGHCRQADKLAGMFLESPAQTLGNNFTVFTSMGVQDYAFTHLDDSHVVRLPHEHETDSDVLPGRAGEYWQPDCVHYSPVGNRDIQKRSLMILCQISVRNIELMIIDLSVEVALLCRTASVPYLYMRLPGDRNDTPHIDAFKGAIGLLAAYPKALESNSTPQWVKDKTLYLGFAVSYNDAITKSVFSQQLMMMNNQQILDTTSIIEDVVVDDKSDNDVKIGLTELDNQADVSHRPIVTIIKGFGGHQAIDTQLPTLLPKIRYLLPNAYIISLGPITEEARAYVDLATQVSDVTPFLQHSTLLIMACGLNAIGEACQFQTPLLVIPDDRPHDEQRMMAQALIANGRAISVQDVEQAYLNGLSSSRLMNKEACLIEAKNQSSGGYHSLLTPVSSEIKNSLQHVLHPSFIHSMIDAKNVKTWFYYWLLPQLAIKPDRQCLSEMSSVDVAGEC